MEQTVSKHGNEAAHVLYLSIAERWMLNLSQQSHYSFLQNSTTWNNDDKSVLVFSQTAALPLAA